MLMNGLTSSRKRTEERRDRLALVLVLAGNRRALRLTTHDGQFASLCVTRLLRRRWQGGEVVGGEVEVVVVVVRMVLNEEVVE
jgi:hypothetical protein